jgi:hypothetical protein
VWALRTALSELLAAAFHLPDVDPSDNDAPATVSQGQRTDVYASLQVRVGVLDAGEVATMVAADGLADVWRDFRNGLDALNAGSQWQDVCWEWRFGLQTPWERHAVDALATHCTTPDVCSCSSAGRAICDTSGR